MVLFICESTRGIFFLPICSLSGHFENEVVAQCMLLRLCGVWLARLTRRRVSSDEHTDEQSGGGGTVFSVNSPNAIEPIENGDKML